MDILVAHLVTLTADLPSRKCPKEASSYNADKHVSFSIYAQKSESEFKKAISGESDDEKAIELVKKCGDLHAAILDSNPNKSETAIIKKVKKKALNQDLPKRPIFHAPFWYESKDNNTTFFFICSSRIKTELGEILVASLEPFLAQRRLKSGQIIALIFWLQEVVLRFTMTDTILNELTRGCDVGQEEFKRLYELRLQIGSTLKVPHLTTWVTDKANIPVQIFLSKITGTTRTPITTRRSKVQKLRSLIRKHDAKVFIHAPYDYNICVPKLDLGGIIDDLKDGNQINSKGVVIHVGKNVIRTSKKRVITSVPDGQGMGGQAGVPLPIAKGRMLANVRRLLEYATEATPLLIETPAGQGSEILTTIEEMIQFYSEFTDAERKIVKICVDTCHVFALGYSPLAYLKSLDEALPGVVSLVHYNDSKKVRGSCVDRHFPVGGGFKCIQRAALRGELPYMRLVGDLGYIGIKRLSDVAEWCLARQIPMVTE